MSSQSESKHILIVGGGIAGKALALFLHKASAHPLSVNHFTCALYESYPPSEKIYVGGGLGLAPNGVAVLSELGLEEELKKRTGVARKSFFWSENGKNLGEWNHDGVYGTDMYGMMRSTVYDILSDEFERKGLSIEYMKRVVQVEQTTDSVNVQFADGSTARGDYLIGADGTDA
jgi:2-polyprenyl-6-methoxyphenol hydroxylase-like FAD-dependent oxidoreductase